MKLLLLAAVLALSGTPAFAQTSGALSEAAGSPEAAKRVFEGSLDQGAVAAPVRGAYFQPATEALGPAPAPAQPQEASRAPETGPFSPRRFSAGFVGLYPESEFTLTTGRRCVDCNAPKEGLWYFEDEVIAVPKNGTPGIVWIGSSEMLEHARLSEDGLSIKLEDGSAFPFRLVPKIQSNRSFYNAATVKYFQDRPLRLRGEWVEKDGVKTFVARTIWPEDQRLDFGAMPKADAKTAADIDRLVRAQRGGAKSPFSATVLWEKGEGRDWAGMTVMGLMLNGAQGDDDEAQAGHFSLFTGRAGQDGGMADWMFDNFYDMDQYSEKGIVAGMVPMDKYMADVNSGQSYYRPTYMAVAVLKEEALARKIQEQFKERYAQYYSHELKYDRTTNACTSLVVDILRGDGWNYPLTGASPPLARFGLSLLAALGSFDVAAGKKMHKFMSQERTHLFPRAAFDSLSGDLLSLSGAGAAPTRELTPFEKQLQDDLEALIFVRLPQFPSSRAFGREPVADAVDYFHRVPLLHSKWKTVPTQPRPFPPPHD